MFQNRQRIAVYTAVAAAVLVAAGCTYDPPSTKAGGDSPPVTLRMGSADPQGRPSSEQVELFAQQVEQLSRGRLRIEPVFDISGIQRVARLVVSGQLDLGTVAARTWDTEGVTSLRALNAPFLVTSEAVVDKIVTGEVGDAMLDGLKGAGVTGLALLPEGLRHLYVFGDPPADLSRFAGRTIQVP